MEKAPTATIFLMYCAFKINLKSKKIYERHLGRSSWERIEGVSYIYDLNDFLNDPEIKLIVISTPLSSHYEYAKKVLEAGKNCLVEKPFTETTAEAIQLFKLAEEKDLRLEACQNRRFDSDFLTAVKMTESGKPGEVFEIESNYDYYRPEVPENIEKFSRTTSFLYAHCHSIDQIIGYFDKPEKIHCDLRQLMGEGRMNDYFDVDMYYPSRNLKVAIRSSYFMNKLRDSLRVYGKNGTSIKEKEDQQEKDIKRFYLPKGHPDFGLDKPEDYGTLYTLNDKGETVEEKIETVPGNYARFYEALYETLVNSKPPVVKPEETIELMELIENAVASMDSSCYSRLPM